MSKGYVGDAMLDESTAISYLTYAENWAEGQARLNAPEARCQYRLMLAELVEKSSSHACCSYRRRLVLLSATAAG